MISVALLKTYFVTSFLYFWLVILVIAIYGGMIYQASEHSSVLFFKKFQDL